MIFRTEIKIPPSDFQINSQDRIMLLGSCFAESIGKKLLDHKLNAVLNPFGILYNPASIAGVLHRLLERRNFSQDDLVLRNDVYQSFMHHGSFSDSSRGACLKKIRQSFCAAAEKIRNTDYFLITFGTAYIYRLKSTGEIVVNCHKFPADYFVRERLEINPIVEEWSLLMRKIQEVNPKAKFIFTVSPIRHWKDGAHENQRSKSILHLSIEKLQQLFETSATYFCAYEILLDELRDYRFFEEDMMHPSATAIEYIWQRFTETYLSEETKALMSEWAIVRKMILHKPFNQKTESYRAFLRQANDKLTALQKKYPHFNPEPEKSTLQQQLSK